MDEQIQRSADSLTELRIDSAYKAIKAECDTALVYQAKEMSDSIIKLVKDSSAASIADSLLKLWAAKMIKVNAQTRPDTGKAANIIRLLKADCDSSLLKETYRLTRQQLQAIQRRKPAKKSRRV